MDLIKCSAKRSSKSCCGRETAVDSDLGSCEHIYASLVECKNKDVNAGINVDSITTTNKRNEDSKKKYVPRFMNSNILSYQPSPVFSHKMGSKVYEEAKEVTDPYKMHDSDFQCPRCRQRMEEPRLLPCLHPICLTCVYELMSKPSYVSLKNEIRNNEMYAQRDIYETCPLCDSDLPNINSSIPPPHYPLQHRLVMDTVRRKLVNRVLCDICTSEVLALIQCSTCLRNFCSECGRQHEQQNVAEARTIKHLMRPLWEATKIRRIILCQIHPMHALRFYCIACQQVTCKECMWSAQHRGHASEDAFGVGKRATAYLITMLQKAKIFLNTLLIQYNHDVFSNNDSEELQNVTATYRYSENNADISNLQDYKVSLIHMKQAQERIREFDRLRKARHLLDAISLVNDLLADGSEIEILTLARIIIRRLNKLGVCVTNATTNKNECWHKNGRSLSLKLMHSGIYHCCTFCSSGGKKEIACGCRGTMLGGYKGCGHGHAGHPGVDHWSCCGSILRNGCCLIIRKTMHKLTL